jgi:hypothetical protein
LKDAGLSRSIPYQGANKQIFPLVLAGARLFKPIKVALNALGKSVLLAQLTPIKLN